MIATTIRLDEQTMEKLKEKAKQNNQKTSEYIRGILRNAVNEDVIYPVWGNLAENE